ncbi:MAG TPA: Rrf2 family transcriptional regulator [Chitinispirillaceae bacterium]|nr:Rrf2 family transcriptional regulator [Chitinispirillaceae bacterium]
MTENSRFYMAVHVLVLLAMFPDELHKSGDIGKSVGVNPVVIRRLLAILRSAGLVSAKQGAGGGSLLQKDPFAITLAFVYRAVGAGGVLTPHNRNTSKICPVGKHIHEAMITIATSVETVVDAALGQVTIGDMVSRIKTMRRTCI